MAASLPADKEDFHYKNKHMNLEIRSIIESELNKNSSFKTIADMTGKDCTTISKEVQNHIVKEKTGSFGKGFNDCVHSVQHACRRKDGCQQCFYRGEKPCWSCGKCTNCCSSYENYSCPKLKKPPYVCNACPERKRCVLEKSFYRANRAQKEYELTMSESRSGVDISEEDLSHLNDVVTPLLRQGQSIHHIALNHKDELMKSERTLYKYVNIGLLDARNLDMPRTVRMRPRKSASRPLKVDKSCRIGRSYQDFFTFLKENPHTSYREIDSVEGVKGGKVLLTILFIETGLQLAFLRDSNDSKSVTEIFNSLYRALGPENFKKLFPVLLADNGSEFSNPKAIEFDDEKKRRTRVFFCENQAPYEKPHCENNHEMIRRCIPKHVDIGQYSQEQISLMMNHINSYARGNLGDKCPYDVFAFQYGEDILKTLGLRKIPPDEIILTPDVFRQN